MVMHPTVTFDSPPRAPLGGTTTRAVFGSDHTAQPPLTSGFGAVMEQEVNIQSSTEKCLDARTGPHSAALGRILRHQGRRLGANIALLEQRYEMLPHPARFQTLHAPHGRLSLVHEAPVADAGDVLPSLIAQHLALLRKIETLISQRPDGQRGELILAEIARNHEEMAWMLTALLTEDTTAARRVADGGERAARGVKQAEEAWDNEGGSVSPAPSPR